LDVTNEWCYQDRERSSPHGSRFATHENEGGAACDGPVLMFAPLSLALLSRVLSHGVEQNIQVDRLAQSRHGARGQHR